MKKNIALGVLILVCCLNISSAQNKQTNTVNRTTYISGETYKTTGSPKVVRSSATKNEFLRSKGYDKVPNGYQVDHIIPLSKGGQDVPSNMQLIRTEQHKIKTANERSIKTTNSIYTQPSYNSNSTFKSPSIYLTPSYNNSKTIYTGERGGHYYINSNGNKSYIKK
jgi:hypothetical protein